LNLASRIFPETLRAIVGNGSITPAPIYRPLAPVIGRRVKHSDVKPQHEKYRNPLLLFTHPDVLLLLAFNGVLYAVFYGVTATISTLFEGAYPFLSTMDIGLCFLAIGGGMVIGAVINGKLLDHDYQSIKRRVIRDAQRDSEKEVKFEDIVADDKFPIEQARLRSTSVYSFLFMACITGYGWCLEANVSIAGPLILQILSACMLRCKYFLLIGEQLASPFFLL
jgi:hypothetical protein